MVCLQEVKHSEEQLEALLPDYRVAVSVNPDTDLGVAVAWRIGLEAEAAELDPGKLQSLTVQPWGRYILNVYAPSGKSRERIRKSSHSHPLL